VAEPTQSDSITRNGWSSDLTHRLRVLLHAWPLHSLRRADGQVEPELRHYDSLTLALRTFDFIIEHMGLDEEADSVRVRNVLAPLLESMDRAAGLAPDPRRHDLAVERLLAGLRNDGAGRHPFLLDYTDFDSDGHAVSRILQVQLLRDQFHADGRIVLRLTNEGINLFLNALEFDLESAQAAAEAVIESQLARGKFNEAVSTAKNARRQSVRYEERLTSTLRETRRDIRRVDWQTEVPRMLEDACQHIEARLNVERNILASADHQLELLPEGSDRAQQVAQISELVRDCLERHTGLHATVMAARNVFLDEQVRQAFAPARSLAPPDLLRAILEPLLRQHVVNAVRATDWAVAFLAPPLPPEAFSLRALIEWQLRPRRDIQPSETETVTRDLVTYGFDVLRYGPDVRDAGNRYLVELDRETTLSALLARAASDRQPAAVREWLALRTLHLFAADEEDDTSAIRVTRVSDVHLGADDFYGDELALMREPSVDAHASS
jgi:hypothetical protein